MEFKKKMGLTILFFIFIVFLFCTGSYAGTQSWNAIDYDVTLRSDGSMRVVETWDVYVSQTNTMFKSFDLSGDNQYKIKSANVVDKTGNQEKKLRDINQYKYHVDKDCFYALMLDDNTYEIAWNVGLDDSSGNRIYEISYTVENAVKVYNDCAELYWKFLSDENQMSGENLTGRIRLPAEVSDINSLRVWGHGNINAYIFKDSNSQASFALNRIRSNEMFEIRVVTDENIYHECENISLEDRLETILSEEQVWAQEANEERKEAEKKWEFYKKMIIIAVFVNVIIFIPFFIISNKYRKIGKELKAQYKYPKSDLEYFRDIPDEKNATPAKAMYLYEFSKNSSKMKNHISRIFSATILNLALKGFIALEFTEDKEIKILRTNKTLRAELSQDEEVVLDLIKDAMLGNDYISIPEFNAYATREYDTVFSKMELLESSAEQGCVSAGVFSEERKFLSGKWQKKASACSLGIFLGYAGIFIGLITPIVGFAMVYYNALKNSEYVSHLSPKGNEEQNQWRGLKNYMEEYSLLHEREVPDIVMWEKYLVYATAFGISKKVLKQLKTIHPEFFERTLYLQDATYLNVMANSNFDVDAFDRLTSNLEGIYNSAYHAYSAANSYDSSGFGGGGGFSGGGGGRRWRRKLWRSLKLEKKL